MAGVERHDHVIAKPSRTEAILRAVPLRDEIRHMPVGDDDVAIDEPAGPHVGCVAREVGDIDATDKRDHRAKKARRALQSRDDRLADASIERVLVDDWRSLMRNAGRPSRTMVSKAMSSASMPRRPEAAASSLNAFPGDETRLSSRADSSRCNSGRCSSAPATSCGKGSGRSRTSCVSTSCTPSVNRGGSGSSREKLRRRLRRDRPLTPLTTGPDHSNTDLPAASRQETILHD